MNDKSNDEAKKQIIVLIISLGLSIFFGFIPNWTGVEFSVADQALLSISLFISFLLLDILWITAAYSSKENREHSSWLLRNAGDHILANLRSNFINIVKDAYSPKDLYVLYFLEEFEHLAERVRGAAEKQELRVVSSHLFVSENLLDTTSYGEKNLVIRYVWLLSLGERLFDDYPWRRYFEQIVTMAKQGSIKSIKVIFIVEDFSVIENPRLKLFLDFFKTNKGLECHLLKADDFRNLSSQNGISQHYVDFGIYGSRLMFRTEQYEPETTGLFTKDSILIRTYTTFFDILWNTMAITRKNPSQATTPVSLDELFRFDLEQPI